jgi:hypothetical protein
METTNSKRKLAFWIKNKQSKELTTPYVDKIEPNTKSDPEDSKDPTGNSTKLTKPRKKASLLKNTPFREADDRLLS